MTGTNNSLKASTRDKTGKGSSRALRREGKIPAVIYGAKQDEASIYLDYRELFHEYSKGHFMSKLFDLSINDKESFRVLPKDVQVHPVTDDPLHVDFMRVEKGQKVNVLVRVKFINADKSPGLKRGGVLNVVRRDIELICDVDSIPEKLIIDLNGLKIGETIHVSSMSIPEGCTPSITDRDFTVATIVGRMAKEEVAEVPAEGEEGEEGAAEGEEGAEASSGEAAEAQEGDSEA